MTTNFSPLSLLSTSRADRASVLMHYMVEDFAGLDWNLAPWQPRAVNPALEAAAPRPVGPALDDVTRRRLHALAGLIEMSREEVERWYVEYWLVYTVLSAYARPLHTSGWGFVQMVARLDGLTQRARTLLPRMQVPGFECLHVTQNSLVLRLREDRPRSARFLCGLLRRLAADFGVAITLREQPEQGASAVCVVVGTQVAEFPARVVEPHQPVQPSQRLRPAVALPAPQRRSALAVLAG
ncbi:MAG: hypothetical protein RL514_47 [Verrucomicrobiota bacterium]|jgi:hypothetical protein